MNAGREDAVCELIEQAMGSAVLHECFVPRYKTVTKINGKWILCVKTLFPGYLIAVTDCVEDLEAGLCKMKAFTKLFSNGKAFIP